MRLKHTELRDYRVRQLGIQDYACALCGDDCDPEEAVLDHDHRTGLIRGVLHRGCNSMLGKIENNMPRSRIDLARLIKFAENLHRYITDTHTELTHPRHKNKETAMPGRGKGRGRKPPKR